MGGQTLADVFSLDKFAFGMATILIRLCLASDSGEDTCAIRFALAFLRFDFCDGRIAFPRRRVRLLGNLTLDAFTPHAQ